MKIFRFIFEIFVTDEPFHVQAFSVGKWLLFPLIIFFDWHRRFIHWNIKKIKKKINLIEDNYQKLGLDSLIHQFHTLFCISFSATSNRIKYFVNEIKPLICVMKYDSVLKGLQLIRDYMRIHVEELYTYIVLKYKFNTSTVYTVYDIKNKYFKWYNITRLVARCRLYYILWGSTSVHLEKFFLVDVQTFYYIQILGRSVNAKIYSAQQMFKRKNVSWKKVARTVHPMLNALVIKMYKWMK